VAAHIHRDQPMGLRKARVQLSTPLQPALRDAMDEEDGRASRVSGLDDMESRASSSRNGVVLHQVLQANGGAERSA
jgi:hypothetical protein